MLRVIKHNYDKQEFNLVVDYPMDDDRVRATLETAKQYPEYFFVQSLGNSFIMATCIQHDFSHLKVANIQHLLGGDGNAGTLIKAVEEWARDNNAVYITEHTNSGNDKRLISLFKRKGYDHVGYVFKKEL